MNKIKIRYINDGNHKGYWFLWANMMYIFPTYEEAEKELDRLTRKQK